MTRPKVLDRGPNCTTSCNSVNEFNHSGGIYHQHNDMIEFIHEKPKKEHQPVETAVALDLQASEKGF